MIYSPAWVHGGFGDTWMCVNFLLRESEKTLNPVYIGYHKNKKWNQDQSQLYVRLAGCLSTNGRLALVDDPPTAELTYLEHFGSPYLPTARGHVRGASRNFTYQFNGNYNSYLKNMSRADEESVIRSLVRLGLTPIDVGGPLAIERKIRLMSEAAFHVGVESGMAHVAISVGMPVYIILNRVNFHDVRSLYYNRGLNYTFFQYPGDFLEFIRRTRQRIGPAIPLV